MVKRCLIFFVLSTAIWTGDRFYYNSVQPDVSPRLAIAAMNGGDADADRLRMASEVNNHVTLLSACLTLGAAMVCFGSYARRAVVAAREGSFYA